MKILFYQQQDSFVGGTVEKRWARIVLDQDNDEMNETCNYEECTDLAGKPYKIMLIQVLEQENSYSSIIATKNEIDARDAIEQVLKKEKISPQVIFSMTFDDFVEIVKKTAIEEFEPKLIATEERNMLFYGMYGEDNSILMFSYFEQ